MLACVGFMCLGWCFVFSRLISLSVFRLNKIDFFFGGAKCGTFFGVLLIRLNKEKSSSSTSTFVFTRLGVASRDGPLSRVDCVGDLKV